MSVWRRWSRACDRASSGQAGQAAAQGYAAELEQERGSKRPHAQNCELPQGVNALGKTAKHFRCILKNHSKIIFKEPFNLPV